MNQAPLHGKGPPRENCYFQNEVAEHNRQVSCHPVVYRYTITLVELYSLNYGVLAFVFVPGVQAYLATWIFINKQVVEEKAAVHRVYLTLILNLWILAALLWGIVLNQILDFEIISSNLILQLLNRNNGLHLF